jgi:hypothetical protein
MRLADDELVLAGRAADSAICFKVAPASRL